MKPGLLHNIAELDRYSLATSAGVDEFVDEVSLPVIMNCAMGGMIMCVVRNRVIFLYKYASSKALASSGDGSVFAERYVEKIRHIEVQIIGDGNGNVIQLWEQACSKEGIKR